MNPRGWVDHKLVVECDGHDFHDRTKARRAVIVPLIALCRSLASRYFRYTGADIWRDVMACATEVIDALFVEIRRVWHAPDNPDA